MKEKVNPVLYKRISHSLEKITNILESHQNHHNIRKLSNQSLRLHGFIYKTHTKIEDAEFYEEDINNPAKFASSMNKWNELYYAIKKDQKYIFEEAAKILVNYKTLVSERELTDKAFKSHSQLLKDYQLFLAELNQEKDFDPIPKD
jgi:hypothetical protein